MPTLATANAKRAALASEHQRIPSKEANKQSVTTDRESVTSPQTKPLSSEPTSASIGDTQNYNTGVGTAVPATPTSNNPTRRVLPASTTPRTMSMIGSIHDTSPVMNETLSVIEEHITDMHTPRHSLLTTNNRYIDRGYGAREPHRLSYINGQETDDEESTVYTEQEVLGWNPEQVACLLEERGAEKQQCQVFRDEEITGEVLLNLDQSSLMLKQFDLGKMGKRLALWHKIHEFQLEVRRPQPGTQTGTFGTMDEARQDDGRGRSTSFGLPRIPSLMESSRTSARHQPQNSIPERLDQSSESSPPRPGVNETSTQRHSSRPSATSVRSLNHNRRHSSIDGVSSQLLQQSTTASSSVTARIGHHAKQRSFDRTWTMVGSNTPNEDRTISSSHLHSPSVDSEVPFSATELGMTVVSSLDLDRGYFSGNEVENRRARTASATEGQVMYSECKSQEAPTLSIQQQQGNCPHLKSTMATSVLAAARRAHLNSRKH